MTRYQDLIESISAGRYWIQATFNITVTSGFVLGDYLYPSSLLDVFKQSGLTHLVIHHIVGNSLYYDPASPLYHVFEEGGLDKDCVKPNTLYPNLYKWSESPSSSTHLRVSHTYQSHSNLLANLIDIRCSSTENE